MNKMKFVIISLLFLIIIYACKKDDNNSENHKCKLVAFKTIGDTIINRYLYDSQGRIVETQYYQDGELYQKELCEYTDTSYNTVLVTLGGDIKWGYINFLPFNSLGLSLYAQYVSFISSNTAVRYDSVFYEYDNNGFKTKEIRWVKFINNSNGSITSGLSEKNCTILNSNITQTVDNWDVGVSHRRYTYQYEFTDLPNKQPVLKDYLGKSNSKLVKKSTYTSFNKTTELIEELIIKEFDYILDVDGKINSYSIKTTSTINNQTQIKTYQYKYEYECN